MEHRRREFVMGTGATLLALAGCQSSVTTSQGLPGASWPGVHSPPTTAHTPPPSAPQAPDSQAQAPTGTLGTPSNPIPRERWTSAGVGRNVYAMGGVSRITIHHEGWKAVWFDDFGTTLQRLTQVRNGHVARNYADIGYHFIIDRAGRVYEGRPVEYQGAHVSQNNEHNLGVMCLGNFEVQEPTGAQLRALAATVAYNRKRFGVAFNRIYTHRELGSTLCPGRTMQPRVVSMRNSNAFS